MSIEKRSQSEMRMNQLSMFEYKPKTFNTPMYPEFDKCYKTCRNFTSVDCYIGTKRKRCCYPWGKDSWMIGILINNVWHDWCKFYVSKEVIG